MDTKDLLRKRFHEATAEADAIRARSTPLRDARDALAKQVHAIEAQMTVLAAQIREAEQGLYELDNERGTINRALGGKTGG